MNKILLIGRLSKQPKLDENEESVLELIVNENLSYSDEKNVNTYVKCCVDGTIAKKVCKFLKKGDLVSVKGTLRNIDENDKDSGLKVIGETISFMSSTYKKEEE